MPTTKVHRPHTIRTRVSDDELEFLQDEARKQDRTIASVIRQALREYAEKRT